MSEMSMGNCVYVANVGNAFFFFLRVLVRRADFGVALELI